MSTTTMRGVSWLAAFGAVLIGCEPYEPEGPQAVSPAAPIVVIAPPAEAAYLPAAAVATSPPESHAPMHDALPAPPPKPPPPPRKARGEEDDTPELFDCLGPKACAASFSERAKKRAAQNWKCEPGDVTAHERPTKGLSVHAVSMTITAAGTAEVHVKEGVKGTAFDVDGCNHVGIIACVPAHRTVRTADKSYDNLNDVVCLWSDDPDGAAKS